MIMIRSAGPDVSISTYNLKIFAAVLIRKIINAVTVILAVIN